VSVAEWVVVLSLCSFGLFLSAARDLSRRWSRRRFERFMEGDWRERWR
jgi:hypothetical protein